MMRNKVAALTGAVVLVAASAANAQPAGDASANWNAVVRCAQVAGADARHACIDQVLRDKGVLDSQRELSDARQSFGQGRQAAPAAVPVPPPPPPPPAAVAPAAPAAPVVVSRAAPPPPPAPPPPVAAAPAAAPPQITSLETQIASVRLAADRKLVITTSEGAIWRQLETIEMRTLPGKGDPLVIEQSALGGHRCKLGSKIFRCQRIN